MHEPSISLKIVQNRREHVNVPKLGRMTTPALLSILISTGCTASWVLSGEWYMLDLMGFGLCCFMMSTVQLDSLKVCDACR